LQEEPPVAVILMIDSEFAFEKNITTTSLTNRNFYCNCFDRSSHGDVEEEKPEIIIDPLTKNIFNVYNHN